MTRDDLNNRYNALNAPNSGWFEVDLPVLNETEKAVCFNAYHGHLDKEKPVWLPKSQLEKIDFTAVSDFEPCLSAGIRYFAKNWLYNKIK